jgi:hypothetical protein
MPDHNAVQFMKQKNLQEMNKLMVWLLILPCGFLVVLLSFWFGPPNVLFCSTFKMKDSRKPYSIWQKASSVFMILALLWLTLSLPFVYSVQQQLSKQDQSVNSSSPITENEEESSNPYGNTTEEKSPNGSSTSVTEEYIHDTHSGEYFYSLRSQYHKCEDAGTYIAYHGELLVPPPDQA